MRRTIIAGLVALLALVGLAPAAADPISPPAQTSKRFSRVDTAALESKLRPDFLPGFLRRDRTVNALVQLDVASIEQQRQTRRGISRADALRRVRASQDSAMPRLKRAGAQVYGRLNTVLNALQIRVKADDLDAIAKIPGVRRVQVSTLVHTTNTASNRFTGVDQTWQALGFTGQGQSVAVIDTGIDYTHADFGGAGTPAAYQANDSSKIERGSFPTAKVTGGYDFVGDNFNPESDFPGAGIPVPDPDPLDCEGHGTHVAGTAAGNGVTAAGATYTGPYDVAALNQAFAVEPGAAPQATLKAYKVFGCAGSTPSDIIVAAIDRAVADGASVINMSLGSAFGTKDGMEAVAISAATQAGVLVVTSAGNDGAGGYLVGGPSTSDQALSVAAVDVEYASYPGVNITGAATASGFVANGATIAGPISGIVVDVGLGCAAADYAGASGKIVVSTRGVCPRVDRATFGQAAGALAVIMINTDDGLPPFEGPIAGVTFPFVGVPSTAGAALRAAVGKTVTITASGAITNPTYRQVADFSSSGPRRGDSAPKPDLAAPGVSVPSAAVGTGTKSIYESGTSMASPHVAGAAALVRQAHPRWSPLQIKAALMSTAAPDSIAAYDGGRAGTGLVQPLRAAASSTFAWTPSGLNSLAFGMAELSEEYAETQTFRITNTSTQPVTYDLSAAFTSEAYGADVSVSPASVTVGAGSTKNVQVTLELSEAAVAALPGATANDGGVVTSLRGAAVATPRAARADTPTLRMTFLLVPVPASDVQAQRTVSQIRPGRYENIKLSNPGIHSGTADLYAWMLSDPAGDAISQDVADITTVGAQALSGTTVGESAEDRLLVFSVGMATGASTQSIHEVDLAIDTDRDGSPDYYTFAADTGLVTAGAPDGTLTAFTIDGNAELVSAWTAPAPTNGSTILLPVLASELGVTADSGPLSIRASGFSSVIEDDPYADDPVEGSAAFDPYRPAVSQGDLVALDPGEVSSIPVRVDPSQLSRQSSLGWLVVSQDDVAGVPEVDRVRLVRPLGARTTRTIR